MAEVLAEVFSSRTAPGLLLEVLRPGAGQARAWADVEEFDRVLILPHFPVYSSVAGSPFQPKRKEHEA